MICYPPSPLLDGRWCLCGSIRLTAVVNSLPFVMLYSCVSTPSYVQYLPIETVS